MQKIEKNEEYYDEIRKQKEAARGTSPAHYRRLDGRNSPARQFLTLDVEPQAYRQTNPLKPHSIRR